MYSFFWIIFSRFIVGMKVKFCYKYIVNKKKEWCRGGSKEGEKYEGKRYERGEISRNKRRNMSYIFRR